jgi:hypothetical protein
VTKLFTAVRVAHLLDAGSVVARPRYHSFAGTEQRRAVLIPVSHQSAVGQRLEADLSAEPLAQKHSRLQRLTRVTIEPFGDLLAV